MTESERIARLEAKVFPPDCPTRWHEWFEHYCSEIGKPNPWSPLAHAKRGDIPSFKGVCFKVCPFCGVTLPHPEARREIGDSEALE